MNKWLPITQAQADLYTGGNLCGRNGVRYGMIGGQLPLVSRVAAKGQIEFQRRLQAIMDKE